MHSATCPHRNFAQFIKIADVVRLFEEAGLPVVAALNDVLRDMGEIEPGLSWHDAHPAQMNVVEHAAHPELRLSDFSALYYGKVHSDPGFPRGCRPFPLDTMLRVHLLQNWFGYSDPAMEAL